MGRGKSGTRPLRRAYTQKPPIQLSTKHPGIINTRGGIVVFGETCSSWRHRCGYRRRGNRPVSGLNWQLGGGSRRKLCGKPSWSPSLFFFRGKRRWSTGPSTKHVTASIPLGDLAKGVDGIRFSKTTGGIAYGGAFKMIGHANRLPGSSLDNHGVRLGRTRLIGLPQRTYARHRPIFTAVDGT